jgi:hypothetical protein
VDEWPRETALFYVQFSPGFRKELRCESLPIFHHGQMVGQTGIVDVVLIRQLESVPPIQLAYFSEAGMHPCCDVFLPGDGLGVDIAVMMRVRSGSD